MHHTRTTRLFTIALLSIVAVIAFAHDSEEESVQIAELMELNPGTVVADVGAGDGNFGEMLARRVGRPCNAGVHSFVREVR